MKETDYVLSICVPTYNRVGFLTELLEELLPEAERLSIEVCVSDNFSTDGARVYLQNRIHSYSVLRVNFQNENVGLDRNMVDVLQMATGRYVYPIGDDDLLETGSLERILWNLHSPCDMLVLNGWHTDASMNVVRPLLPLALQGQVFTDPLQAFLELWDLLPFGTFLALRQCFSVETCNRYLGTSHAYSCSVWDRLVQYFQVRKLSIRTTSDYIVKIRGAEKTWQKDEVRIFLCEIPKSFQLLSRWVWKEKEIAAVFKKYRKQALKLSRLLIHRSRGSYDLALIKSVWKFYTNTERFLLLSVLLIPVPMLCGALALHRSIKRRFH